MILAYLESGTSLVAVMVSAQSPLIDPDKTGAPGILEIRIETLLAGGARVTKYYRIDVEHGDVRDMAPPDIAAPGIKAPPSGVLPGKAVMLDEAMAAELARLDPGSKRLLAALRAR